MSFRVEDGTVLRGYLHTSDRRSAPAVVMAHGFSGVKEQIDHYAERVAESGYTVLVYDHRSFGASDGRPRREVDAARQLADWRDAISFVLATPEAQPDAGVAIWGSSFAGGLAIILAATDQRVRCVVSQIPHVSGARNARYMFDALARARLEQAFDADRSARYAGQVPMRVPVFASDPGTLCALPPAMSRRHIEAAEAAAPAWKNEVTLRSVEAMLSVEPAAWAPLVSPKPFLMIVGARDTCTFTEHQLDTFEHAREPKKLVIHPGGHFDTYTDHFELTAGAAVAWFQQNFPLSADDAGPPAVLASRTANQPQTS